jgi:hypothetical protein
MRILSGRHSYISANLAKISVDEIALNRQGRSSDRKRQTALAFARALIEKRGKNSDGEFTAVKESAVHTPIDFPQLDQATVD